MQTQFLIDMLLENGYKRVFLENLVKTSNAKKKTLTVAVKTTQGKLGGYLILDKKLGKDLKRKTTTLPLHKARTYKTSYVNTNQI